MVVYLELNLDVIGKWYFGRNVVRKWNINNEVVLLGGKFVSVNFKWLGVIRVDWDILLSCN